METETDTDANFSEPDNMPEVTRVSVTRIVAFWEDAIAPIEDIVFRVILMQNAMKMMKCRVMMK